MVMFSTFLAALMGALIASFAAEFIKSFVRGGQIVELRRDQNLLEIEKTIESIVKYGEEYWSNDAKNLGDKDRILQAKINANQHYLSEVIAALFEGETKHDCDMQFSRLMKSLTGDSFSELDRVKNFQNLAGLYLHSSKLRNAARQQRSKLKRRFLS